MNNLLNNIWRVVAALWRFGGFWGRVTVAILLGWPVLVLLTKVVGGGATAVSLVALLPPLALLGLFFVYVNPLAVVAISALAGGRKFLGWVATTLGVEFIIGAYLSMFPIMNQANLVLLLVVAALGWGLLLASGHARWAKVMAIVAITITLLGFIPTIANAVKDRYWQWEKSTGEAVRKDGVLAVIPSSQTTAVDPNCQNGEKVYVSSGETHEFSLLSDCWTGWITTPLGTDYRVDIPDDGEVWIQFMNGKIVHQIGGRPPEYVGVLRGVFRFRGRGKVVVGVSPS